MGSIARCLSIFMFLICVTSFAQYKTTSFSYATVEDGICYWSDWEDSDLQLDIKDHVITINSADKQIYTVVREIDKYKTENSLRLIYSAIDKSKRRITIRFEFYENKNQIYIDYNNVIITYMFK